MGVGEDFQKFKDCYQITTELISSISYRYKRITRQLNTDFWNTDSETAHSLYVGSYGRDTAAKGLSDLDIGFILPNAVYHQYNRHQGNGQSALLQAVKKSVCAVPAGANCRSSVTETSPAAPQATPRPRCQAQPQPSQATPASDWQ
jgi:Second Messenger Oligonucleotide or Dinucleotide Synthetase domain